MLSPGFQVLSLASPFPLPALPSHESRVTSHCSSVPSPEDQLHAAGSFQLRAGWAPGSGMFGFELRSPTA